MCPVTHGVHDWKLEYQEPLEGRFIGMRSVHWMKKPEEYQYGSKMSAAHKQDWYFHCNGVLRNIVLLFWCWKQEVQKCMYTTTRVHRFTSLKTAISIINTK
jgi:hypothetical protein